MNFKHLDGVFLVLKRSDIMNEKKVVKNCNRCNDLKVCSKAYCKSWRDSMKKMILDK